MAVNISVFDYVNLSNLINVDRDNVGGSLYLKDFNTIYKFLEDSDLIDRIPYLINLPEHQNVIKPNNIVTVSNQFSIVKQGYSMKYLLNSKRLLENSESYNFDEKMQMITELFDALKFLHQYIVIGDISSNNILTKDGKAYLIDLDNYRKLHEIRKVYSYIYTKQILKEYQTKSTDIIKLYIEAISFLLNHSFDMDIYHYGYKQFYYDIIQNYPKEIADLFKISNKINGINSLGDDAYKPNNFLNENILTRKK